MAITEVAPRMRVMALHLVILVTILIASGTSVGIARTSYYNEEGRCKKDACHDDAECLTTGKNHRCKCKDGFYGNGKICIDDDECEYENGGCVHFCINTHGNYTCSCLEGFYLAKDGHNCIDVNECETNKAGCDHECDNIVGSYECRCRDGYSLAPDGRTCLAGTWCRDHLGCSHYCQSTAVGMKCVCRRGYRLHSNRRDCVLTCSHGNGGCAHRCIDSPDGPICSCQDKYIQRNRTCIATCGISNGDCDGQCDDTPLGPKCSCPLGYLLHVDGRTCIDIDECISSKGGCSHSCVNSPGSYDCTCPVGYKVDKDGRTCKDVNECLWNTTCDQQCTNTDGGYRCHCNKGYDIYGRTHCADINECSVNNGGCQDTCTNTEGGFQCQCQEGFRLHLNKRDCVVDDAKECPRLKAPPKTILVCSMNVSHIDIRTQTAGTTCHLRCDGSAQLATPGGGRQNYTTRCGPNTNFHWTHELNGGWLRPCSERVLAPGYQGRAKFMFFADNCTMKKKSMLEIEKQLGPVLIDNKHGGVCENGVCKVTVLDLKCDTRKRRFRHLGQNNLQALVSTEFELHVKPLLPAGDCGIECARDVNGQRLKKALKRLKTQIDGHQKFIVQYEGKSYEVLKKSLKSYKPRNICDPGQVLVGKKCVACSTSTFYSVTSGTCEPCPPDTFQDREGQLYCTACDRQAQSNKQVPECREVCEPGSYSADGLKPCKPCSEGAYQPDYGRTVCRSCGPLIATRGTGSVDFQQCLVKEYCKQGHYYKREESRCLPCPRGSYQSRSGQDFCIDCPKDTDTDNIATSDLSECKSRRCGGETDSRLGYLQSPNWPGNYPANSDCVWKISPEKGRRILLVIPEIFLASSKGQCEDSLVMRKSSSVDSLTTYESCNTTETPIALTSRSRNLWIRFKSDHAGHAKGFSIPYVTYSEEYQDLIEDIVSDNKLYNSYQHQQALKDRRLLAALLEVIEQPYSYFKYANVSQTMFPESFIRLLRNKVVQFFSYNRK